MKTRSLSVGFLLVLFAWAVPAWSQTIVEEHWSPYNYPREIPEDKQVYFIKDGDNLWDIAARLLKDPYLWPELHRINAYITDSDLIYPGDPLVLDVGVVVSDDAIAENLTGQGGESVAGSAGDGEVTQKLKDFVEMDEGEEEGTGEGETVSDRTQTVSLLGQAREFVILPAGDRNDMDCSSYVYASSSRKEKLPFDLIIAGGENHDLVAYGYGEVVYLNKGHQDGIKSGDVYSVRRNLGPIYHPHNWRQFLGYSISQVGRVRVVAVQEVNATAIVTGACYEVRAEDFLVPYEPEPIPLLTELPTIDPWQSFDNGQTGYIVMAENNLRSMGEGNLASIDLGLDNEISPGDLFVIFRNNPQNNTKVGVLLPDLYLGQGVALRTSDQYTTMKIIYGTQEIRLGDKVIPLNP